MPGVPKGWLGCPPLANDLIDDKFLVFKTPYTNCSGMSSKDKFTVKTVVEYIQSLNQSFVCWIDLTNTKRYYDPSEVSRLGLEYHKMPCLGHGHPPSTTDVQRFLEVCRKFKDSGKVIGIHCTHGFNRTGYLICKYLMAEANYSAEEAILYFAKCRPPGIYRKNYIEDLCSNKVTVPIPSTPPWVPSSDSTDGQSGDRKRKRDHSHSSSSKKHKKRVGNFYCDLPIIEGVDEQEENQVRNAIMRTSGWYLQDLFVKHHKLKNDNKEQLFRGSYAFKLKATKGRKYILYIEERDRVYFLDSDLNVFKANLVFPMLDYQRNVRHLFKTIVVGEMKHVYPTKNEEKKPDYAFVIEDIIVFRGEYVAEAPFFDRMKIIKGNLIDSRRIQSGRGSSADISSDVLSIELDQYHKLPTIDSVVNERNPVLPEKIVFYAMREPFSLAHRSSTLEYTVVKTSVNFRIRVDSGKNYLCCRDSEEPFSTLEEEEDSSPCRLANDDIVQCRYKSGRWILEKKLEDSILVDSTATAENAKDHRKLTVHSLKKFLAARFVKFR